MATTENYLMGIVSILLIIIAGLLIYRFFFVRQREDPEDPGVPLYPLDPSSPILFEKTRTVTITTNDESMQVVDYPAGITYSMVRAIIAVPVRDNDSAAGTPIVHVAKRNYNDGKSWIMYKYNLVGDAYKVENVPITVTYVLNLTN